LEYKCDYEFLFVPPISIPPLAMKAFSPFLFAAGLFAVSLICTAHGQVNWAGSNGTWQNGQQGGFDAIYNDGNATVFGNITANNTVTIVGNVAPSSITINNTANTYTFTGGNITGTGTTLSKSGAGTAIFDSNVNLLFTGDTIISGGQLRLVASGGNATRNLGSGVVHLQGGTLRLAGNASSIYTVTNNFTVSSAGGTIDVTQLNNNPVWNLTGSLNLGGNLTIVQGGSGGSTPSSFFTGGININQNNLTLTVNSGNYVGLVLGPLNGTSEKTLSIQANAVGISGGGISLSGNNSFSGTLRITSSSFAATNVGVMFSSAPTATGLTNIQIGNNGTASFSYAVASPSDLSNLTFLRGSSIRAFGTNGSFVNLGSDVMNYVLPGGALILDNSNALNNNRLSDTANITLNSTRFYILGSNATGNPTNEVIGSLTLGGGSVLSLDNNDKPTSSVDLTVSSLSTPSAGDSLLISTRNNNFGAGQNSSTIVVTGSKPQVTNGMISPGIQQYNGVSNQNALGDFVTFSGDELVVASYTNFAGNWSTANATDIVNVTGAATLTGSGNLNIHALRVASNTTQNLGGRTVVLGSGGLIMTSATISNGTLDFGSNPGFIGVYNPAAQAYISAVIAGSGGITVMGTSQRLNLNSNSTFTGGLFVNGGTVSLNTVNAANGNNVTINALGILETNANATIGGVSGYGRLLPRSSNRTITLSPSSGTHIFNGTISNNGTSVLSVIKSGSGTQVFGADAVASYTGTTTVNAGTLLVNTTLGGTGAGAVTVNNGATLGGNGTIIGNTTINAGGTLAPGNSPGILTFNGSLTLSGTTVMEINGTVRGTQYDGINMGSGLLTYGGTLSLNFGSAFLSSDTTFDLFQIGSGGQTGTFSSIVSSSVYNFTLNSGNSYTANDQFGNTWSFNHSTGDLIVTIPEPSTWVLLACGLTMLIVFRRRRLS